MIGASTTVLTLELITCIFALWLLSRLTSCRSGLIEDYYQALFDYADSSKWGTVFTSFGREFDQGTGVERGRS